MHAAWEVLRFIAELIFIMSAGLQLGSLLWMKRAVREEKAREARIDRKIAEFRAPHPEAPASSRH